MKSPKRIFIINGPNLQALGMREPEIYGSQTLEQINSGISRKFPNALFNFRQSNIEGELIDFVFEAEHAGANIIINPGGYSHTSVSLSDAIKTVTCRVVEVHLSNIHARESYRQSTLTGAVVEGVISGLGSAGYELACAYMLFESD